MTGTSMDGIDISLVKTNGIDLKRLVVVNVVTIEEFRSKALRAIDIYLKTYLFCFLL